MGDLADFNTEVDNLYLKAIKVAKIALNLVIGQSKKSGIPKTGYATPQINQYEKQLNATKIAFVGEICKPLEKNG